MNKHIRSFTLYALPFTLALALQLCAFGAEKISYSGKLAKPDGSAFNTSLPMTMTFRLYTGQLGGYMLWGRTMPVRIAADGSFYVELSDEAGSPVPEAATEKLAEALVFGEPRRIVPYRQDREENACRSHLESLIQDGSFTSFASRLWFVDID